MFVFVSYHEQSKANFVLVSRVRQINLNLVSRNSSLHDVSPDFPHPSIDAARHVSKRQLSIRNMHEQIENVKAHMGQCPQDGENGQNVAFFFLALM